MGTIQQQCQRDGPDGGRVVTTNSFMAVKLNDQREIF